MNYFYTHFGDILLVLFVVLFSLVFVWTFVFPKKVDQEPHAKATRPINDFPTQMNIFSFVGKDAYKKFRVKVGDEGKDVYFELKSNRVEIGWHGEKVTTYLGHLKDEPSLKSGFLIVVFEQRTISLKDGKKQEEGFVHSTPEGHDEHNAESFLQKIMVENEEEQGKKIIADIWAQIKGNLPLKS